MRRNNPAAPRVTVVVDTATIAESVQAHSSHCMIAEAVRRAYPGAQRVSVDIQTVRFSDPERGLRFTYLTPRVAQIPLIQFDQGIKPTPFKFQLRGGQVTVMGSDATRRALRSADGETRKRQLSREHRRKLRDSMRKARLAQRNGNGTLPDRVGGKTPPVMPMARRRAFGLRALAY